MNGFKWSPLPRHMLWTLLLLPMTVWSQTLPTATQVAAQIQLGWNLGNTLEAQCGETAWGNPAVTQQFINSVKAAGFNAIRIPAAWDCHANQSTMTLDATWMARVKQVVDYAHGQGMVVILNIHWDGGWLEEHPLYSYQTAVNQKQNAYWTQIATTFRDYNERLLFAGTNEVHADYGTPTAEHIAVQQSYNQTFVNAVRATGGNNASRTLVVQTYNTNAWHGLNYFSMPTDTAANRLIVEIHHYDPYDFTLNQSGSCLYWGAPYPSQSACTWAQEAYHDDLFAQVKAKWVSQNIPVIIGEYGVATRPNLSLPARQYYLEYVNRAAASNGIKTFYWDNGVQPSQTNGFAIFDRNSGAVVDQGVLDAVKRGAGIGTPVNYALTVTKAGAGSGTVTSTPSGINCGATCSASYSTGTSVTLTATAASGSTFSGWSGACSGTSACTVSMTVARAVTATFSSTATTFPLAVTKAGTGSGTVTASPSGINCGSTCTANYASGTSVTLTAAAASGSAFAGWSGACTGTSTCTLSMTAARNVTATFNTSGTGGTCSNPISFTNNTGNFNTTGAVCYRTSQTINGWGCSNFDGRTLTVGGQARTCGQLPLTRSADGYYYFSVTGGTYSWASLYAW
ncbi:cellulase family glycosylhydrolase [Peristeroidobacter soli]|uniref:cellulase family glycosylhydrolase n=1 Tax=Peristeroidobacter soli TaxID=2497877 RepID=UPI0013001800|nr:cellulase family glycosylhydrolase [Peristeroidobacter soli]